MKAKGIDFGGYTEWRRDKIKDVHQVDFVICGIAWGKIINPTWAHNKPQIKDEERRLLYQFFNHAPSAQAQADLILEEVHDINAHAVFIDVERSKYGLREDLPLAPQAVKVWEILSEVEDNFNGKVDLYSNFNDYHILNRFVPLQRIEWWCAWPDEWNGNEPGSIEWWNKIKRAFGNYKFDQWSWKGYAPDYGAVNNKKSMDLTQFKYSLAELDKWLDITDDPLPPPPDCDKEYNQAIQTYMNKIIETGEALKR